MSAVGETTTLLFAEGSEVNQQLGIRQPSNLQE
jgi:hypothetical protein